MGSRAERSTLDFHIRGCVRRKLARLLPTTCTRHLAIVITFMHSLNKHIEGAHMCQALSWVQGYRSKLNKVHARVEPVIYRLISNVTASVKPSQVTPDRKDSSSHPFVSIQSQERRNLNIGFLNYLISSVSQSSTNTY